MISKIDKPVTRLVKKKKKKRERERERRPKSIKLEILKAKLQPTAQKYKM